MGDLPGGVTSADPGQGDIEDTAACQFHGSHVAGTVQAIGGNNEGVVGVYPGADNTSVIKVFTPFLGFLCLFTYASELVQHTVALMLGPVLSICLLEDPWELWRKQKLS